MSYAQAVADLIAQRLANEEESVPLNALILARAVDAILPGQLSSTVGFFVVGTRRLVAPSDLMGSVDLPGCRFRALFAPADLSFDVSLADFPEVLKSDFNAGDLPGLIGDDNVAIMAGLADLWDSNVRKSGLLSGDQCDMAVRLCHLGIIVTPELAENMSRMFPTLAVGLREPPDMTGDRRLAWTGIVTAFKPIMDAYADKNLATARQAVADAKANVALWDGVYSAVNAIAVVPSELAAAVLNSAKSVLLTGPVMALLGVVVLGLLAIWFLPSLLAARTARAASGGA